MFIRANLIITAILALSTLDPNTCLAGGKPKNESAYTRTLTSLILSRRAACGAIIVGAGGVLTWGWGESWFEPSPIDQLKKALAAESVAEPNDLEVIHLAQAHSGPSGEASDPRLFEEVLQSEFYILNRLLKAKSSKIKVVFEGYSNPLNVEKKKFLESLEVEFLKTHKKSTIWELSTEEAKKLNLMALDEMKRKYGVALGVSPYIAYRLHFKDGLPKTETGWTHELLEHKQSAPS